MLKHKNILSRKEVKYVKSELHAKKMTKEKVLSAREAYENGATITNLAAEYNVAYCTM